MAIFNSENHVKNLPDAYRKTQDSNNFKILEIERVAVNDLRADIQAVEDSLDIDKAVGKTLDLYGDIVQQPRGIATDPQYVLMIKSKIMRNVSTGDYPSIAKAICTTFNCEPSLVLIEEADEPCVVNLVSLPLGVISKAGLTTDQTMQMIRRLMPVGIRLDSFLFEGTFEFAANEGETDTAKGFTDTESGTIGGYLGVLYGGEEADLPI